MALAELQAALARLSTDPAARALFIGDPQAFADAAGLSPEELASLREMAESSLKVFAHSLLHKRSHETARAMPLTREALGGEYGRTFEAFAATHPVARDPAIDALRFLEWLPRQRAGGGGACEAARYERAWLLMRRTDRRWHAGVFNPPGARSRFLAIWWRMKLAAPVRFYQWPAQRNGHSGR